MTERYTRFNPRPLLLTGESPSPSGTDPPMLSFNPRPLLLTGESFGGAQGVEVFAVSIHARYC